MGKRRETLDRIADDGQRKTTFNKRVKGLMKKAYELVRLCDCRLSLSIVDCNGHVYAYNSSSDMDLSVQSGLLVAVSAAGRTLETSSSDANAAAATNSLYMADTYTNNFLQRQRDEVERKRRSGAGMPANDDDDDDDDDECGSESFSSVPGGVGHNKNNNVFAPSVSASPSASASDTPSSTTTTPRPASARGATRRRTAGVRRGTAGKSNRAFPAAAMRNLVSAAPSTSTTATTTSRSNSPLISSPPLSFVDLGAALNATAGLSPSMSAAAEPSLSSFGFDTMTNARFMAPVATLHAQPTFMQQQQQPQQQQPFFDALTAYDAPTHSLHNAQMPLQVDPVAAVFAQSPTPLRFSTPQHSAVASPMPSPVQMPVAATTSSAHIYDQHYLAYLTTMSQLPSSSTLTSHQLPSSPTFVPILSSPTMSAHSSFSG
ncbi:Myocyte-specific enhancer factor 2C [Sorochytrium milnesiophthora]